MTRHIDRKILIAASEIADSPKQRACSDHNFELPNVIYGAMVALFVGAVAVLATAFNDRLLVTYGIVLAFLVAFFALPAIFVKASPLEGSQALTLARFRELGIDTATGRTGAVEATVLALILPALIFCWAIAVALIAAVVG